MFVISLKLIINPITPRMKKYIFIVLIFTLFLIVSCATDETCIQTKYVKLTAGFYHAVRNDSTQLVTSTQLSFDSITVQGLKLDTLTGVYHLVDSILYNNNKQKLSTIDLPLNNFAFQSKFKLTLNSKVDTLTIYHQNFNEYLSLECGCIVKHTIDTVSITRHFIDSVQIRIHDVNTLNAENIRLYK